MPARLEIRLKRDLLDAEGAAVQRKAAEYFGYDVQDVRVIRVLTVDAELSAAQLERIRTEIFTNPVTEESSYCPMAADFDWLIWVGLRPGVRDTGGSTAMEAIEDLLTLSFEPHQGVYASKLYEIRGRLGAEELRRIATELLANDIIQQSQVYSLEQWSADQGIGFPIPRVVLDHEPRVETVTITSDEELRLISAARNLALHDSDIPVIRSY